MKCSNCGAIVGDDNKFCTSCGCALTGDTNRQMNQNHMQEDMTQYMYQQTTGTTEQNMYQQATGAPEQNMYQQAMGTPEQNMYQQAVGIQPQKKKMRSKKPIIIALSVIAFLAIAVVVYLFPLGGRKRMVEKKNKKEITNSAENYLNAVENMDVEQILKMTISKSLLKDLVNDALPLLAMYDSYYLEEIEEYTGSSVDEIVNNFDKYYDMVISLGSVAINQYFKEYNVSVEFDDPVITSIKPTSVSEIIEPFYGLIDTEDADYLDKENVSEFIDTFEENYGLDFDNMYAVYVKTGITVSAEGETFSYSADEIYEAMEEGASSLEESLNVDLELTDSKNGIRVFLAYKYKGEYYLIPDITSAVLPAFYNYIGKSKKSNDITTAKSFKTAVETAMGIEQIYIYFTEENAGKYFEVTESGFAKMDPYAAEEICNYFGNSYPEVKYTDDGQKYFTFMVSEDGTINVYISDGSTPDTWQILPEIDDYYY